ncbi:hypothetical protein K439DRAFT_503707 [Ramaria rubella]|nr:hypothetical protein K439DRAFT_503707 [Ramaria rubella]
MRSSIVLNFVSVAFCGTGPTTTGGSKSFAFTTRKSPVPRSRSVRGVSRVPKSVGNRVTASVFGKAPMMPPTATKSTLVNLSEFSYAADSVRYRDRERVCASSTIAIETLSCILGRRFDGAAAPCVLNRGNRDLVLLADSRIC